MARFFAIFFRAYGQFLHEPCNHLNLGDSLEGSGFMRFSLDGAFAPLRSDTINTNISIYRAYIYNLPVALCSAPIAAKRYVPYEEVFVMQEMVRPPRSVAMPAAVGLELRAPPGTEKFDVSLFVHHAYDLNGRVSECDALGADPVGVVQCIGLNSLDIDLD